MNYKNLSLTLWGTFVAMATYTVLLATRPTPLYEKTLIIWDTWEIKLPFEVSYWWNLVLITILALVFFFWENQEEVFGKQPRKDSIFLQQKYNAKLHTGIVTLIGLTIMMAYPVLFAFTDLFFVKYGPLSNLATGFIAFLGSYVALGFLGSGIHFLFMDSLLDDKWSEDQEIRKFGNSLRFKYYLLSLIKMGIFWNLPFILGGIFGFIIRFVLSRVYKVFKNKKKILETS